MPEFCSEHSEHQRAISAHDKRLDRHSQQLDDAKDERFELRMNLQKVTDVESKIAGVVDRLERGQANHEERITALEEQPARDAKRIKDSALGAFGGAIGTGVIALIVLALVNSIYM